MKRLSKAWTYSAFENRIVGRWASISSENLSIVLAILTLTAPKTIWHANMCPLIFTTITAELFDLEKDESLQL